MSLLVDVDPQGNLTSGVGLRGKAAADGTIYAALMNGGTRPATDFILRTDVEGLSAIPPIAVHGRGNRARLAA